MYNLIVNVIACFQSYVNDILGYHFIAITAKLFILKV